ncbi:hypothetical protein TBR22_A29040 [Luteitalea sp. TBR-22]|uniref:DUF1553 domain-containing protein n=1 Tax=Luteitalea sp. TBR-22 TaxID=2802971 RepID=UPI001AF047B8|nr:DUF1553 domain-containing protein [Luteitalea sp. TBR-22]BCS33677.1 hypothetical protein TBR22_A29040 [Luteitalea sp. TBR-22]
MTFLRRAASWGLATGLLASALAAATAASAPGQASSAATSTRVSFTRDVRPLLSDRCFRCHGPDPRTRKARLRLDTRDGLFQELEVGTAVVVPGAPERSELIRRVSLAPDDEDVMPPADAHLSLSDAEKALLRQWVVEGAEFRGHWSWEPIVAPAVPPTSTGPSHPVDAFVRAALAGDGIAPSPRAAPDVLLRRVTFSLTGLPPTPAELEAFRADPSEARYAAAIERLLASPAYGERMAADWLDLARYADTYGYQADVTRDMSPYRDWVIGAFNSNLPYDQFLTWQLAGDLLPGATRAQRIATAFNRLHRQTNEGGSIEAEFRTEYVADRVNTFGTAMLGLGLECARCHDHKFDPITQRDYFSLFAFFNSIDESGLYSHFTNATPSPSLLLWPSHAQEAAHARVVRRIAALEHRLEGLAPSTDPAFQRWQRSPSAIVSPSPIAAFPFDTVVNGTTPGLSGKDSATLQDGPALVDDGEASGGKALRFSGDNAAVLGSVRQFSRTDAFSVALRIKPTERQDRAVVIHQSRAWTDAGSRGFELTLEDGRPSAALVHFWPGNAIAIRAREPLPRGAWSSVVVTYDGSSRASGLALYLDGTPVPVDIVRDRLYKDILYDPAAGDLQARPTPLTIGARFRDSGFRNGLVDDLRVYDVALTAAEVAGRVPGEPQAARAHYLARVSPEAQRLQAQLRQARVEEQRRIRLVPELMVMEELPEARPAHLLARGAYDAPGPVVPRDTPASLPPLPKDQPRNRLGLARWLTSRDNPLTARVAVNRIWKMHFGRGLVASAEDFGSQGRQPTHPELLDWLAARFIDSGWDVKAMHRLIVGSQTFQQASDASPDLVRQDPENLRLARGPAVRLPAEHVRDSALAASGLLVRRVGGRSVKPYQPEGLWEQSGTGQKYVQDHGAALYRRSLYTFWRRTSPPPSMTTFDAVSREVCVARRETTQTPLQALVLLNDPQFVEAARVLAERLVRAHPSDPEARHRAAFLALAGRPPTAAEARVLAEAAAQQRRFAAADPKAAAQWLAVGERPRDARLPVIDVAATMAVTTLIMNTEAFVVTR